MDTSTALWTLTSYLIIGLTYFAIVTFGVGLLWRLWGYLRTPMPWPEVTTPAPETESGSRSGAKRPKQSARERFMEKSLRGDP